MLALACSSPETSLTSVRRISESEFYASVGTNVWASTWWGAEPRLATGSTAPIGTVRARKVKNRTLANFWYGPEEEAAAFELVLGCKAGGRLRDSTRLAGRPGDGDPRKAEAAWAPGVDLVYAVSKTLCSFHHCSSYAAVDRSGTEAGYRHRLENRNANLHAGTVQRRRKVAITITSTGYAPGFSVEVLVVDQQRGRRDPRVGLAGLEVAALLGPIGPGLLLGVADKQHALLRVEVGQVGEGDVVLALVLLEGNQVDSLVADEGPDRREDQSGSSTAMPSGLARHA